MNESLLNSVFKAYDIRGRVPQELTPELFYNIGRAYVTKFEPRNVVIGYDIRTSSKVLQEGLVKGVIDSGCDVYNVGEIATEMISFAVGEYADQYDGGMVVTASHNPAGWNGCKIVGKRAYPIGEETGLNDIKNIILKNDYRVSTNKGSLRDFDLLPSYKRKVRSFINHDIPSNLRIAVDAGNGVGGKMFDFIFGDLPIEVDRMYFEPDGSFPNHVPNPVLEENVVELEKRVVENKYDFGIALDGDSDRVFFVDKEGRKAEGIYTGILLARAMLNKEPGAHIVHGPRVVFPIMGELVSVGAIPILSKVGHSHFEIKMREFNAVFGMELSAHYYYKDFYFAGAGMITIAVMLDQIAQGLNLTSQLFYLREKYPTTGEVNYLVENYDGLILKIEEEFKDDHPQIIRLDGISLEFDNWRCNIRKSNTQPLMRVNVEGRTKQDVIDGFNRLEEIIESKRENEPSLEELQTKHNS